MCDCRTEGDQELGIRNSKLRIKNDKRRMMSIILRLFHHPIIASSHNFLEIFGSTSSFQVANVPSRIFWRAVVTRSR